MTKQDLIARYNRLIEEGTTPLHADHPVRLDDVECAVDMFGDATPGIDLELDRFVEAWPTGHRTAPEESDEHFMLGEDYVLD